MYLSNAKNILFAWVLLVFFTGVVYFLLAGTGNGIVHILEVEKLAGFWDSIYFSAITASSVGYGEIVPVGVSRIIASVEGLVGVVLISILAIKLVSSD